ncbi:MAG: STAS domain-containing protein [Candidatus Riflebacteria bacterium]|nr:STAS domain-containing protein [Candidatus Riflebacteria bacterium]
MKPPSIRRPRRRLAARRGDAPPSGPCCCGVPIAGASARAPGSAISTPLGPCRLPAATGAIRSPGLIASVVEDDDQTRVVLAGELGTGETLVFKELLDGILERRLGLTLVLDLASVQFLGTAGLAVLAAACRILKGQQACLTVLDPTAQVERKLVVTHLTQLIRIERTGEV